MTSPSERLRELGITLPTVAAPAGSYVPARRTGSLVFTAGQIPFVDDQRTALKTAAVIVEAEPDLVASRRFAIGELRGKSAPHDHQ